MWIPIVYLCTFPRIALMWHVQLIFTVYPETRNRSLESIDALFSTTSPFYWKMEQAYKLHGDVLAEHGVNKSEALAGGNPELYSFQNSPTPRKT